jgi:dipeptidase D
LESAGKSRLLINLSVTGLRGGHSGVEINAGRLNAIHAASKQTPLRLAAVTGGDAPNAIPREAFATVIIPSGAEAEFRKAIERFRTTLADQHRLVEPTLQVSMAPDTVPTNAFSEQDSEALIQFLHAIPSGVIAMSQKLTGLVETLDEHWCGEDHGRGCDGNKHLPQLREWGS